MDKWAVKAAMLILATGILNSLRSQRGRSCASCAHATCAPGRMPKCGERRDAQKPPSMHGGFTLLELLLVILIIGIILSFAALSIGRGNERAIEDEMRRLAGLIELAAQEATLESQELAVQFNGNKYEFLTFEDNKWERITNDDTFRARTLPKEMLLSVRIEDEPVKLGTETSQETEAVLPRIYLLSSGEITPFQLTLKEASKDSDGGNSYQLNGNVNGKIEMRLTNSIPTR